MRQIKILLIALCAVVLFSCGGLTFSQQSLDEDQQITSEAIALMQKTNEPYTAHAAEADQLRTRINQLYQREQTRKMNNATVAMWQEVIDGKGNLFDLLNQWKINGQLSTAMTAQATRQVERLLNSIYDLEKYKKK